MADAGTPLIRAEDRALASPSGSSTPDSQNHHNGNNAYPAEPSAAHSGSGYFGRGGSPPLNRSAGADSNLVRLHGVGSVSPPDRVRVELASHEHDATAYQLSDHLDDDSASSSSAIPAVQQSSRMGRRRSSSSRGGGGLGRGLLGLQHDSNLARAQDPLLHRDEHAFVALDMEELLQNRWRAANPEDVFVHTFSFLTPAELASASTVNRSWSHAAYEPSLWTHMDLSPKFHRVDDAFLIHLLGSRRFVHLQYLSLEGCSAITNKALKALIYFCPNLRELRLTDCAHITNPWLFPELVKAMPYLRRLELIGATKEYAVVVPMLALRAKIDLGLFWLEYCAENGIKTDGTGLADCRFEEGGLQEEGAAGARAAAGAGGAGAQRGCWGRIRGRLVYSSNFYHRGGNYPREVLYSCENHAQSDYADPDFHRCQVCECLFRAPYRHSMWTELICKVCFDKENLHAKTHWVPLDAAAIRAFNFADILSKTIHVASRKNLPVSLRSFGTTPARLDYTLPDPADMEAEEEEEEEQQDDGAGAPLVRRGGFGGGLGDDDELGGGGALEEHKAAPARSRLAARIDPTSVPLSTFNAVNGWRVDESVHAIKAQLKQATEGLNTRALLVYDAQNNVEVLADKRVILDGKEGEEHMQLTVQAWHIALEILYPIVIVLILSLHFSVLFARASLVQYDGRTNYAAYITPPPSTGMSTLVILLIALAVFAALVVAVVLIYRFREQCERCFKRFLVADILLILMFGVATLLWLLVLQWRIYLDSLTFAFLIWNLSIIGLITLYYPMPDRLHHFILILLNAIMAIMLIATLSRWLIVTLLFLAAVGDMVSEARPQLRLLSPFIIPAHVELIYNTPKILYTVGGLRLRAADLLWYGLINGLAISGADKAGEYWAVLLGGSFVFLCSLSSLALLLFVAPFVGLRFRPLPLAIVAAFVLTMIQNPVIQPFIEDQNHLTSKPVVFG